VNAGATEVVNPRGQGLMLDNAVGIAGTIVGGFVFREFGAAGISRIRRKVVASCGQIGDTSMANNDSPPFRPEQICLGAGVEIATPGSAWVHLFSVHRDIFLNRRRRP
jgi:hypothetical protein